MQKLLYVGGAAAIFASYAALFFLGPAATDIWVQEDGIMESVGALALFATSVCFLLLLIRGRRDGQFGSLKQIVLVGLVLLFFFAAGEEISWGQRILGIATPAALEAQNAQEELNLHNLEFFSGLLNANNFFRAFWVGFGVVLPVAAALSKRLRAGLDRLIPVLPLWVAVFLILQKFVSELAGVVNDYQPSWYEGSYYELASARVEMTETVVAVILACGAYALYRRTKLLDAAAGSGVGYQPSVSTRSSAST